MDNELDVAEANPLGDLIQWLGRADLGKIADDEGGDWVRSQRDVERSTNGALSVLVPQEPLEERTQHHGSPRRFDFQGGGFRAGICGPPLSKVGGPSAHSATLAILRAHMKSLAQDEDGYGGVFQTEDDIERSARGIPELRSPTRRARGQDSRVHGTGDVAALGLVPECASAGACCGPARTRLFDVEFAPADPVENDEEVEWDLRQRQTGAAGRLVMYGIEDDPREDIMLRGGRGRRVVVTAVREGGKAAKAGIKPGDVLASIDGHKDFVGLSADVIHMGLTAPVVLVFMGFVGKLQAEVRLNHKTKACGLAAHHQVILGRPGAPVQIVDEVVFRPATAALLVAVNPRAKPPLDPRAVPPADHVYFQVHGSAPGNLPNPGAGRQPQSAEPSRARPDVGLAACEEDDWDLDVGDLVPNEGSRDKGSGRSRFSDETDGGGVSAFYQAQQRRLPTMPVGGWLAGRSEGDASPTRSQLTAGSRDPATPGTACPSRAQLRIADPDVGAAGVASLSSSAQLSSSAGEASPPGNQFSVLDRSSSAAEAMEACAVAIGAEAAPPAAWGGGADAAAGEGLRL